MERGVFGEFTEGVVEGKNEIVQEMEDHDLEERIFRNSAHQQGRAGRSG